jgi:hypothetical protein
MRDALQRWQDTAQWRRSHGANHLGVFRGNSWRKDWHLRKWKRRDVGVAGAAPVS